MSDVDSVVRDALAHRAEGVRAGTTDPLPEVQRRAARIRNRRSLATVASVVAGLSVAATVMVVSGRGDRPDLTVTPAETGTTTSGVSPTPAPAESSVSPNPSATSQAPTSTVTVVVPRTRQDALEWGLAVNPDVIREVTFRPSPQGVLKCGVKILGEDAAMGKIYAWIGCQDYFSEQGHVKEGAAASLPAVIHVVGGGADTAVTQVMFPRQANLAADIRRLFPAELRDTVTTGNIQVDGDSVEWLAQAERELAGQVTYQVPAPPDR